MGSMGIIYSKGRGSLTAFLKEKNGENLTQGRRSLSPICVVEKAVASRKEFFRAYLGSGGNSQSLQRSWEETLSHRSCFSTHCSYG
jgi:hypothetical protein